ncbi:Glu-tRNA(Gln) amidotransferase subunit GatE [Candidatus Micrarchaeota archaeon]|nr:Glu-tRNA(Gln) amidotransferase subunit GatE [Candidatus Micrarchaeota archaeon]
MEEKLDFKKIGFRSGIEIHQRLATKTKLFCDCSAQLDEFAKPSGQITRRLKAVVGELGQVDPAAAFEQGRGKTFVYQLFEENSCLVDQDDQPPKPVNQEALEIVLQVAKALNAQVLPEVHVMRKTVVDGSAPSAFQRTALVAVNGELKTSKGIVGIQTICLEEESAGIVEKKEDSVVYRLDRLGIPLIEIATDASLQDPSHVKETALLIGQLLRATGKVQRGIGSIRQDLNVSVTGGSRTEIKGSQELDLVPKLVENEARRQLGLLEVKKDLEKRKAKPTKQAKAKQGKQAVIDLIDLTNVFKNTSCAIAKKAVSSGGVVLGVRLQKFEGLLGFELFENYRVGTELSGVLKAVSGLGGLFHSDEDLKKYGFSEGELDNAEKELGIQKLDAFIMVAGGSAQCETGLNAVFSRAMELLVQVPGETRRAEGEKSFFMRPIPGKARMYPETDLPPVQISEKSIDKAALIEPMEEKIGKYEKLGLNSQLAERLVSSRDFELFEWLVANSKCEPQFIATTLLETIIQLKRDGFAAEKLSQLVLKDALDLCAGGKIVKPAVLELLKGAAAGRLVKDVLREEKLERICGKQLLDLVKKEKDFQKIMRIHRLRVDASELRKLTG